MFRFVRPRLLLFPLLLLAVAAASPPDLPTLEEVRGHLDRQRYAQAIEDCRELVAADEENGLAWYYLAYGLLLSGRPEEAVTAGRRALETGGPVPTGHYNLGCAYEAAGQLEEAERAVQAAIAAGFLDFDLIATDPDLVRTRARGNLELPEPHAFSVHEARNRVELPYELLLPEHHDPERATPAVVLFPPGPGPLSAAWALQTLCDGDLRRKDCIVLLLVAPERGWFTHPAHHALEDLLKHVRREHEIAGDRFHLVGFGSGTRAASTYAGMSGAYFQSFTSIGGEPFGRWDDRELTGFRDLRLRFVSGAEDGPSRAAAERAASLLGSGEREVERRLLDGEGGSYPSLHHGAWLAQVLDG